ncbi:ABC transporter permease [Patescibacteria group bacterium]|nr:ABC transporter permease [Patescibacteria group bacterium]
MTKNTIEVRNAGATGMGQGADLILENDVRRIGEIKHITRTEKQVLVRNIYPQYFPTISITIGNEPGKPLRVATHGEPAAVRIIEGRNFTPEDKEKNVAIAGKVYAQNRGLTVGSRFTEQGSEAQAGGLRLAPNPTEVEIIGIFASGFAFGDNQVILPFKTAQRIYGLENRLSVAWVTVDETKNVEGVEQTLRKIFAGNLDVLTGQAKARFVVSSFERILGIGRIGLFLSFLVGALVVLFTMILTTNERTKEIGVLKALGASNGEVAKQFIVETISVVLIGGVFGLLVFMSIGPSLVNRLLGIEKVTTIQPGIEMGIAPVTALLDVSYATTIPIILMVLGITLFFAILGSFYPVWRAIRMKPAEALRYE